MITYNGWCPESELLKQELSQREEEGFLVPDDVRAMAAAIPAGIEDDAVFQHVYDRLECLEKQPDFLFYEPNDLAEIRAARPVRQKRRFPVALSEAELLDKNHGAWLGRSVGCALGKPVELMGMNGRQWRDVRTYLRNRGDWPLADYFSGRDVGDGLNLVCPRSQRENIRFMESDDDIRYSLIGLLILEKFGLDFSSYDVASLWNLLLPMRYVCTAERQALLNFNLRYACSRPGLPAFEPAWTRMFRNPFREWIGAQIRADFFGFAVPGNPELAAELAWRDASWTHVKNGIYGAMFIAAMESAAFAVSDPAELVQIALGEIPENCRLAAAIRAACCEIPLHDDMESFMPWVEKHFGTLSPVHTINNAVLCVAALFYGGGVPDRAVCQAVTGGLDTDCNGATVGAVCGIIAGAERFGGTLASRLNDTICAEFGEFQTVTMTALARRTLAVQKRSDQQL